MSRYLAACPKPVVKYGEQIMSSDQTILDVITDSKVITPPEVKAPRPPKKLGKRGPLPQAALTNKFSAPLADAEQPDDDADAPELPPATKLKAPPEKASRVMKSFPAMKKALRKAMKKTMKVMKARTAKQKRVVARRIRRRPAARGRPASRR